VEARFRGRGWGKSVVAAMVQYLLENGRPPLYVAADENQNSMHLSRSLGFIDSGLRAVMLHAVLRPRP
ncbi:MAG: GNAT family N-acetyltransferase, partial [Anaerolineae bacterium]